MFLINVTETTSDKGDATELAFNVFIKYYASA